MAVVTQRRRTLHNPPPRRNPRKRRTLSPKQIKFFGTPAQKAGLKRRSAAKRNAPLAHRRRRAKRNPGEIVTAALSGSRKNPETAAISGSRSNSKRRSNPMATARRRARRTASTTPTPKRRRRHSSAHSNPPRRNPVHRRRKAHRNPSMVRSTGGFIKNAAYLIAGAVGSKAGTQAVLGANNTGFIGYGANLIAAFAIGKLIGMFTKDKQAENSAILGGVGQVVLRFLIDQTPFGATLKTAGFGDYQFQSFVIPQRLADGLNSAQVVNPMSNPMAWRPAPQLLPAAVAKSASGVAGLSTIGQGLYGRRR